MKRSPKLHTDVLIIRWLGFHVGAVGLPAILALILIVSALFTSRLFGLI